ncbi:MAG: DUF2203 family protein [Gemmatimonadota bacterium]|jgi:hypothetical protein|nr:hypothetical protein [Gemmatimonadota bacterium]MDP6460271.1 DUF2203 family protein [Gemmatimonadota bacterium]MDP6528723.1 DUF2203 family protein [Gemmatimonadota bacterium]MDP7032143.1 DUF2203 family protein [Gemmatimonadota bacterium]
MSASQEERRFSIREAEQALPLVRSIARDAADKWKELIRVREEFGNSSPEHDRLTRELSDLDAELKTLGCHLKDFESGLVEFPGRHRKRDIQFSWMPDEEGIRFFVEPGSNIRLDIFSEQAR